MNRPDKKDYGFRTMDYIRDLEEYCDRLESANESACDFLNLFDLAYRPNNVRSEQEWKEIINK